MPTTDLRQAIETFHTWRRDLLLPGHQVASKGVPDPELVLSSKMLKVFSALHPEFNQHIVQLQLHFLEKDYTNRVQPEAWKAALRQVSSKSQKS